MCDITSMENALVKAGQICSLYTKGAAKEGLKISCSIGWCSVNLTTALLLTTCIRKRTALCIKPREKAKMFLSYLMKICCDMSRFILKLLNL